MPPGDPGKCISQELDRSRVHLRALSAPFLGLDREVLGTVTVFHDITSFKDLDEMKNDFVRMVSHELRAPLAAIKQQHAVILDGLAGELSAKQAELLGRATGQDSGAAGFDQRPVDLAKMEAAGGSWSRSLCRWESC